MFLECLIIPALRSRIVFVSPGKLKQFLFLQVHERKQFSACLSLRRRNLPWTPHSGHCSFSISMNKQILLQLVWLPHNRGNNPSRWQPVLSTLLPSQELDLLRWTHAPLWLTASMKSSHLLSALLSSHWVSSIAFLVRIMWWMYLNSRGKVLFKCICCVLTV